MIPRITTATWGGPSDHDDTWFQGRSISVEWLGLIVELNIGKNIGKPRSPGKGGAA